MNRLRTLALLAAAVVGLALPATASGDSVDNAAVAINTRDDSSVFRLAFKVTRAMSDVVDNTNVAYAYSSCERCRTVAVAIQIVLIMSDPSVVTTTNVAMAVNYQCKACQTLASAYQFVVTTGGPVRFTAEAHRRIAEIKTQLRLLRILSRRLSIWETQRRIDALMDELRDVLRTQLVPAGRGDPPEPDDATTEEGDDPIEEPPETPETVETSESERTTSTPPTTTTTTTTTTTP